MDSVFQKEKYCHECGTRLDIHEHHIFSGYANRKKSEKYGLKVYLCSKHHNMSDDSVHFNPKMNKYFKTLGQMYFEEHYGSRQDFIREFGKSWL